ncbi:MAG: BREX-3 system phosphatase PglZ, partial [Bacteroidetes bacterium]|nr:BREX-3 system phosphatase PglZ [Bacteroidota bacterium]
NRYAGLHNQPAAPPVMLHHIPRALARNMRQKRIAFLLIDGMALDQWIIMRNVLHEQCQRMQFHESAVFAWMPTITSVSRQAAFAGKAPLYFPASIQHTEKEGFHWTQFWLNQGLTQQEVLFMKGLDDGSLDTLREAIAHPRVRVIGLIIDKIDKIMHGMELGMPGMHNQIRQWTEQGFMGKLIHLLLENDFQTFLTSDHGNIEAKGYGRPSEGIIAEVRGQRVRIYPDKLLRSQVKDKFPDAVEWPAVGLPDDFLPLLAPNRMAFIKEEDKIVGHGGISIEELIVPFINILKK